MKKLLFIILGASIAMLAACGGESNTPDNQSTVLQFSQHGAITEVTQEFYHNPADFKAGWDKAYGGVDEPPLPNIDFTKNTVAMYAIGQQKHGGYQIRVLRAVAIPDGYAVGFQVTIPGLGCHNETEETTRPFIFISVPTTQDITFDEVNKRNQPSCTAK